jgi:hypothetical protein
MKLPLRTQILRKLQLKQVQLNRVIMNQLLKKSHKQKFQLRSRSRSHSLKMLIHWQKHKITIARARFNGEKITH